MPLNFPKQKVNPSWGVLKEKTKYKKIGGGGDQKLQCVCLFLAAVYPLWGQRRQKEKGKQPMFFLFLPLQFANVAQRTFHLGIKKESGGGEVP